MSEPTARGRDMSARPWTRKYGQGRVAALRSVLELLRPGRCIDLGAGHGRFTRLAVERGWDVVSLDARGERYPDDLHDKAELRLASVDSDAWRGEDFDLVLCMGLHYHLSFEMQDRLFARCAGRPLLLDTHVAVEGVETEWASRSGPWTVAGGIPGTLHPETRGGDEVRKTQRLLASYENDTSFWPTAAGLTTHLRRHGYTTTWTWNHEFPLAQRVTLLALT